MNSLRQQWRRLFVAAAVGLICCRIVSAADEATLTKDQIKTFLLKAKIVGSKQSGKGVTSPWRLTLSDGTITHDASFQAIDEHKPTATLASGKTEMNFVDSYKYNIAAYQLSELLGMDDMLPVYVERTWQGNSGSLSWLYKIRVFDQLVYDADPNLTNLLISADFKIWRVDFSRAFRLYKEIQNPNDLTHCDRQLFEKLKALNGDELAVKTKHYLNKEEIKGLMARRDKIVEHFQQLIAQKGEQDVLY